MPHKILGTTMVFIIDFKQISHCSEVFIVDFEELNANLERSG